MRALRTAVVLVLALALAACGPSGGLHAGVEAYDRGDYATAMKKIRPLAEQGNADAQVKVGAMYEYGKGVTQDYAEAVKWLRLAADQGLALGQLNLGNKYFKGEGVPQDYVQAHMWLNLAAAQGKDEAAEYRERVAEKMTPADISKAQRLAREWKPK